MLLYNYLKNWPCLLLYDSRDRLQPPPHPSGRKWTLKVYLLNKHYIFMQLYQMWLTLSIHKKITVTTVWATCSSLPLVKDSDSVLGVWGCLTDLLPALFISFARFHILSCLFISCWCCHDREFPSSTHQCLQCFHLQLHGTCTQCYAFSLTATCHCSVSLSHMTKGQQNTEEQGQIKVWLHERHGVCTDMFRFWRWGATHWT